MSELGSFDEIAIQCMDGLRLVPFHLRDGLEGYILRGVPVGSFLTACIENDLLGAVNRADPSSLAGLKGIMQFLYNFTPGPCWGSAARRKAWQAAGGAKGQCNG